MRMDHEELASRLEKRLDKIEEKLDKHLEIVATNKADLSWVKGYIRISLTSILALVGGLLTTAIKVFLK